MQQAVDIPEIVEMINHYLTKEEFLNCTSLTKDMRTTLSYVLYKNLSIANASDEFVARLKNYPAHIQKLTLFLDASLPQGEYDECHRRMLSILSLRGLTALRVFRFKINHSGSGVEHEVARPKELSESVLPALERLIAEHSRAPTLPATPTLPTIQTLNLLSLPDSILLSLPTSFWSTSLACASLRTIELTNVVVEEAQYVLFLHLCSKLHSISLTNVTLTMTQEDVEGVEDDPGDAAKMEDVLQYGRHDVAVKVVDDPTKDVAEVTIHLGDAESSDRTRKRSLTTSSTQEQTAEIDRTRKRALTVDSTQEHAARIERDRKHARTEDDSEEAAEIEHSKDAVEMEDDSEGFTGSHADSKGKARVEDDRRDAENNYPEGSARARDDLDEATRTESAAMDAVEVQVDLTHPPSVLRSPKHLSLSEVFMMPHANIVSQGGPPHAHRAALGHSVSKALFVRRCPSLESLTCRNNDKSDDTQFFALLAQDPWTLTRLESLTIESDRSEDEQIAKVLQRMRRITSFKANATLIGRLSIQALLVKGCDSIEVLRLRNCEGVTSEMTLNLLEWCPNLRVFSADRFKVQDIPLDGEWLCRDLREFDVFIERDMHQDTDRDQEGASLETQDRIMQRAAYSRLGTLTKLRRLSIIAKDSRANELTGIGAAATRGLDVRLDAGLEHLTGLSELCEFVYANEGETVTLGSDELKWMAERWPWMKTG
ncbi:hypothetical protein BGZ98_008285 [Dissophora globulifera]|nr:hypothetical protein BGZ98_008285 [Dissophora globulifera]